METAAVYLLYFINTAFGTGLRNECRSSCTGNLSAGVSSLWMKIKSTIFRLSLWHFNCIVLLYHKSDKIVKSEICTYLRISLYMCLDNMTSVSYFKLFVPLINSLYIAHMIFSKSLSSTPTIILSSLEP